MTAPVATRANNIAAQALFDPPALAASLVTSLNLAEGAPRLLLAAPTPASLAALSIALRAAAPAAVLTLTVPDAAAADDLRAHLAASACDDAFAVAETALQALDSAFGPASFDAIALPGRLFSSMLPHEELEDVAEAPDLPVAPARDAVNAGLAAVVRVLHAAKAVLATNGRLYVDCVRTDVTTAHRKRVSVRLDASGTVGTADIAWTFAQDPDEYTQTTTLDVALADDGTKLHAVQTGVLATMEQLRAGASYAGFTSFDACAEGGMPDGDSGVRGYVARVTGDEAYYDRALAWYSIVWNDNGMINWGLWNKGFPSASYDDDIKQLADTDGGDHGALIGANLAFNEWVQRKVDAALAANDKSVRSVLDVGCGTGRGTMNLAMKYRDTLDYALGVDPGAFNIEKARSFAAAEKDKVGLEVEFFHGVMEDAVDEKRMFDLAWTESALVHASDEGRRATLQAIGQRMPVGGLFMLNDWFKGYHPLTPRSKLHLFERLHVPSAWSFEQYVSELRSAGFRLIEYVDLSEQKSASYMALSKSAARCAAKAEKGSADEFMLRCLELDYRYSSYGAGNGESTWAFMLCRRE